MTPRPPLRGEPPAAFPHRPPARPEAAVASAAPPWAPALARPQPGGTPALAAPDALQVRRLREQIESALADRDRAALHGAKQEVLHAAYRQAHPAAARRALVELSWHMAGLLLPRHCVR